MKKVVGLLAGLCLCAGCENEIPEPTASVVSAGKFVVDYNDRGWCRHACDP